MLLQMVFSHSSLWLSSDSDGKESACKAGDPDSVLGSERSPGERNDNPLQYSGLEKPNGQRKLLGYSLGDRKDLDITE